MQTVFLKNGTQAVLVSKTERGYVVDPMESYKDYETHEEYQEASGNVMLVDKVYETAPLQVIQEEYKDILSKVQEQEQILEQKRQELRRAQYDVDTLRRTKTDVSRWIINREELRNAKRLTVFVQGQIVPRTMDGKSSTKFTFSYEISQYQYEEKCWTYKLWSESRDSGWSGSDYYDAKYGILVDLTDEEIKTISMDRLSKLKQGDIHENYILNTPDEWLTPEWLEIKKEKRAKQERERFANAEKRLKEAQEEYNKLAQKELTVS